MNGGTYYHWAWICPDCKRHYALPYEPAVWNVGQQRPLRPDFEPKNFECCGQIHEIARISIQWLPVVPARRWQAL